MITLKISDITIKPDRQRKEIDHKYLDELSESIRVYGLINPIIVDETNTLIAGYCRIKAHEMLGRTEILARQFNELDTWEKEAIELEENIRRKNLTYEEQLSAELKLFEHFRDTKPAKSTFYAHTPTARKGFSIDEMAKLMGFSYGKMNERLSLAKAMKEDPTLGQFKNESQAKHELQRRNTTTARIVLAKLAQAAQPKDKPPSVFPSYLKHGIALINADAREVIPTLTDDSIGCLITDPPWNVEFDAKFGSDPSAGFGLMSDVLKLLLPKLQPGSLCLMYCATRHLIKGDIYRLVQDCGYAIYNTIHIWYKPQVGASSVPYRELKNDYEPAILFSKGLGRDFNFPMFSVIPEKIEGTRIHEAQKPLGVLKKLVENFTSEGEIVIDPFMGSAQSMLACKQTNRNGIGIEKDPGHYSGAILTIEEG